MYRSFLLRMWVEDEQEAAGQNRDRWHAEVLQIQSGESWTFGSRENLLSFLQRLAGDVDRQRQLEE